MDPPGFFFELKPKCKRCLDSVLVLFEKLHELLSLFFAGRNNAMKNQAKTLIFFAFQQVDSQIIFFVIETCIDLHASHHNQNL